MSIDYGIPKDEYHALMAERDRLREERREYQATIDSLVDECADHKAENAKLRELAKEAHLCMVNEGCCEDCYATQGECPIERDMRELGVEVD